MRYSLLSITPTDKKHINYEIIFSNGENNEIINVATLAKDTWYFYSESGKAVMFYSSLEDLINDFMDDLNKEFDGK